MKNSKRVLSWMRVVAVACLVWCVGCNTTADYTLGGELTPGHQQMDIYHRHYKGGEIIDAHDRNNVRECKLFEARLFRSDSVAGNKLDKLALGVQHDEEFGSRKMSFASQYLFMSAVTDSLGFGYRPVYDSMCFRFAVDTFAGDTLKPIRFNVYELTSAMLVRGEKTDSVKYLNYDPRREGHLSPSAEPIFTFEFPNQAKGIYTTSEMVRMEETPASADFIRRLMCLELDENGLANGGAEAYKSDSAFIANFHGLYIEPDETSVSGNGSAYTFTPSSTGINLFGRTRSMGNDSELMADTLNVIYYFRDQYAGADGNYSAQRVEFDYSSAAFSHLQFDEPVKGSAEEEAFNNRDEVELCYVDGCGGVVTELRLTDEFLLSLRTLNRNSEGEVTHQSAAVNQAALKIYIEDASYDYDMMNPVLMGEKMDKAMNRLGLYTNFKSLTPIPDYMYSVEASGGTLVYGGYMNRSLACYEMNITSYIQEIINSVLKLEPDENGKLDFSKLALPRKIFLGPEATNLFDFLHTKVQGADSVISPASIELELTYTLVR